ncbi:MAG: nitroreductase family protein [Bdellovibrionales bacterium]|nr:nitroreductase family protein [Bdellovibrionales bacterium]
MVSISCLSVGEFVIDTYNCILSSESDFDPVARSEVFFKQMSARRTIREFSSEPIDRAIVLNAIKTAGTAPSGANRQPWYFALITSQSMKDRIREAAEKVEGEFYAKGASQGWIRDLKPLETNASKPYLSEAPALIAVFSRVSIKTEDGYNQRTYYPVESTGISVGLLITALHNAGLATLTHTPRPMFFLNSVLNLNHSFRPFMIVVTGYAKKPVKVPDIHRKNLDQIMGEY